MKREPSAINCKCIIHGTEFSVTKQIHQFFLRGGKLWARGKTMSWLPEHTLRIRPAAFHVPDRAESGTIVSTTISTPTEKVAHKYSCSSSWAPRPNIKIDKLAANSSKLQQARITIHTEEYEGRREKLHSQRRGSGWADIDSPYQTDEVTENSLIAIKK